MCDTLCARTSSGMLFAKNSDRPVDELQLVHAVTPHRPDANNAQVRTQYITIDDPGPGITTVLSRPHWLWGAEHAVNAAGVAIGNEKVWTTDDPRTHPPALIGMDLVRLAAQRATTADTAVDLITSLLERYGQGGSGEHESDEPYWSSFLVVDPTSGWIVETSGRSWVAAPVSTHGAISNRLTLGTGWTRSSADVTTSTDWQQRLDPAVPTAIADHRLAATGRAAQRAASHLITSQQPGQHREAAQTPGQAPGQLVAALRDHGKGPWGAPGSPAGIGEVAADDVPAGLEDDLSGITVCMHVRDYQCTTASMVTSLPADPTATIGLWASIGPTCCAVVLPGAIVRRDAPAAAIVPAALNDPVLWQAASLAARRSETSHGDPLSATTTARKVFGPIEAAAWEQAAELTANNASARTWAMAADRWSASAVQAAHELLLSHRPE